MRIQFQSLLRRNFRWWVNAWAPDAICVWAAFLYPYGIKAPQMQLLSGQNGVRAFLHPKLKNKPTKTRFFHRKRLLLCLNINLKPCSFTLARSRPIPQPTPVPFPSMPPPLMCSTTRQHAADRFGLADAGNIYGRLTNSTQDVFEKRIAALEGGVAGLAVASGAAAIAYTIQALAQAGRAHCSPEDHLRRHLQPAGPYPAPVWH